MSETTIGVSLKLKRELSARKRHGRESYEDVLWRVLKR
jgi:hypothetical protein